MALRSAARRLLVRKPFLSQPFHGPRIGPRLLLFYTAYYCEAAKKKQKKATSMVKPDLSPCTMASSLADFFNAVLARSDEVEEKTTTSNM